MSTTPTAPAGYDAGDYPPFANTVDLTVFTIRDAHLCVLLVQRSTDPYAGAWALPGGFVHLHESLDAAASRELAEEAGLGLQSGNAFGGHLEQLGTWGEPTRDPRMRVVSIAYLAFAPNLPEPAAGSDAADARWWAVADLDGDDAPALAFDHREILAAGVERVRSKLEYTTLSTRFVAKSFTLGDLHRVYETVWGQRVELRNFRRKVTSVPGFVQPVPNERALTAGVGRPAALYRAGPATVLVPALMRGSR